MTSDSELSPELLEILVPEGSIRRQITSRLSPFEEETVKKARRVEYEEEDWEVKKANKASFRMQRPKKHDVAFEDQVWAVFGLLGFRYLNKDRHFRLPTAEDMPNPKQIDVFAADDETVLVVECKSSAATVPPSKTFKEEVDAIVGRREATIKAIKKEFPKHKIKFIFATNNYRISDDARRDVFEAKDIALFDEKTVSYFLELSRHMGHAGRFQLLGFLFRGSKIENLDLEVAALKGKMAGEVFYTFLIEPSRLLKVAFVSHQDAANDELNPTYQRLIKKTRLQKIRRFVEHGGFFPNSLIVNLGKKPHFDQKVKVGEESRAGVLRLPAVYQSVFVIDGQHRLYGYTGSSRAETELIPVVAFVGMDGSDQVRLFMEINENQKAVPKNLRSTLNADLLWGSSSLREQERAARLRIAQFLGSNTTSALNGRVILGEDRSTDLRCLSMDFISKGLEGGHFLGKFSKSEMQKPGSFYRGDIKITFNYLRDFLNRSLNGLAEGLPIQYELGRAEGGFVFINSGVEAFIRLLGDIVDFLVAKGEIDPRTQSAEAVFEGVSPFIDMVCTGLDELDEEGRLYLKGLRGSTAPRKYWRRLQELLRDRYEEFNPDGLDSYLSDEERRYNVEAFDMIGQLEVFMRADIKSELQKKYGDDWFRKGLPVKVQEDSAALAAKKNAERSDDQPHVEPWDQLYLIDLRKIITKDADTWKQLFEERYSREEDLDKQGREARTKWLEKLNKIRSQNVHSYVVSEEEHEFVASLKAWLIPYQGDTGTA
jgi:DNA sulfur modification protein DndB